MVQKPSTSSSHKSQRVRFIEAARALGADEDEAAFKEKLAVIARQKPKPTHEVKNDEKPTDD